MVQSPAGPPEWSAEYFRRWFLGCPCDVAEDAAELAVDVDGLMGGSHCIQATTLGNSESGSAKYQVYHTQVENDYSAWYPTTKAALEAVVSQPQNLLYFHDSAAKGERELVALRMDDSTKTRSGMMRV